MDVHKISLPQLFGSLQSSPSGISSQEAQCRLRQYGKNILEVKKKHLILIKFLKQFLNFFSLLLFIGSIIAFIAEFLDPGQGYDYIGIALLLVIFLNSTFTFIQEYKSERIMASFKKMLPHHSEVLRDGKRIKINLEEIVPGDIILLDEGNKVPADARLIEFNNLRIDHSSITGESEPQLRSLEYTHENILDSRNVVLSGTLVLSGNGKAIVFATGNQTQIGKIAFLTRSTRNIDSPLHKEISHFIKFISVLAVCLGVFFYIISYLLELSFLSSLIFAIGIIVANIPEGLLPTVTLALSLGARRMAKKKALVRNLESVETLGSTTVICTDKTGTLTQNKMQVNTIYSDLRLSSAINDCSNQLILKAMVLCNNAKKQRQGFSGDPTEVALLDFAKIHLKVAVIWKDNPRIAEFPFDSRVKRMITINKSKNKRIAYLKGAPEVVLEKCSHLLHFQQLKVMGSKEQKTLRLAAEKMASSGERVLALAYKNANSSFTEENFIFLGFIGMIDPPRPEVSEAIQKCKLAGIKIIMITGDHSLTAQALARQVGLLQKGVKAEIILGEQLENMDEQELRTQLKKDNLIFARTSPTEKLRIVQALQSMGEIVTVTGDGVNDAPALKNADLGVAMGISGTEVAREASDIVLMDDNFATIVNAIEEGRTIFDNIRKFINYILTSNVPEIIPFIVFALFNFPLAITILLILCIDLGTDILPAVALGTEKVESDIMKRKPRAIEERLLNRNLLIHSYLFIGLLQVLAGFFAFTFVLLNNGWSWGQELLNNNPIYQKAVTAFFASIVLCQIANVMISRTRRRSLWEAGLFSNAFIWLGIIIELLLLALIVYLPQTQAFFGTQPLTLGELLLGLPFAFLIILFDELRKYLIRHNVSFAEKHLAW